MAEQYRDKFTEATEELEEKSAFTCVSCDSNYTREQAREKANTCCGKTLKELLQEGFGP